MLKKFLFLLIVLLVIVNVSALDYSNFGTKEEFVGFLEEANEMQLDLRNNYELSLSIKEQAEQFSVDLYHYPNLELYDSIFSKFSWYLTGFVTGSDPIASASLSQTIVVPGDKISVEISNTEQIISDEVSISVGGKEVAVVPKTSGDSFAEILVPDLSAGEYEVEIGGSSIEEGIEIVEPEIEGPLLKLNENIIESGQTITITGANMPLSTESYLNILADNILLAKVTPFNGVFELDLQINLDPGNYIVSIEGYKIASDKLTVKIPDKEPILMVSETSISSGDPLIIFGENFEFGEVFLSLYGGGVSSISNIGVIIEVNGNFEYHLDTSNMALGKYTIFSNNAEASFKIEEVTENPILNTDMLSVIRGNPVTLMGQNFEPESGINLILNDQSELNAFSDVTGRFSVSVGTDSLSIGSSKLAWQEDETIYTLFNVEKDPQVLLPELRLSTQEVSLGTLLGFKAFNIPDSPQSNLKVLLDGEEKMKFSYPNDGILSGSFLIPEMELGEHTLMLKGFSTAEQMFIYSESFSGEPRMSLFKEEGRFGDSVSGTLNGLPMALTTEFDIIFNGGIVGQVAYNGVGGTVFNFNVPQIIAGTYGVGIAGIDENLAGFIILEEPSIIQEKTLSTLEVQEITLEVQEHIFGVFEEEEEEIIGENNSLQQRVLSAEEFFNNLGSETCERSCDEKCGQITACGRCPLDEMNTPGKCGNPFPADNLFDLETEKISGAVDNFLGFVLDQS